MNSYESFVYCWTDTKRNMLYVGKHKGDIDDGYICSSKYFLSEYKKRPDDFIRTIIATGDDLDMISLETSILMSENARFLKEYYNMHNNNGPGTWSTKGHTDKTKQKLSKAKKGVPLIRARGPRPHVSGKNNHFYGKKHSPDAKEKMSGKRHSVSGGKNPNAVMVKYKNKVYSSIKEFCLQLNLSHKEAIKLFKDGEAEKLKIVTHTEKSKNKMRGPRENQRGSNNHMSVKVQYEDKTYDSKSDLCREIGITKYELSKMVASGKVKEVV